MNEDLSAATPRPPRPPRTGTAHPLHLLDLDPTAFERLVLWLAREEGFERVEHYGSGGTDHGRDVRAYKRVNGAEQLWYFQCKRRERVNSRDLTGTIDAIHSLSTSTPEHTPQGIIFAIAGSISATRRDAVRAYAETFDIECEFWARTELDERLKRHPRLLAEFFQISQPPTPEHTTLVGPSVSYEQNAHDVFICHAFEDKLDVAKPLALALRERNIRVWYDEFSIEWGDSLRQKIDLGVASCRYGVVVLSPAFFSKRWPQYELDGLAGREFATGSKIILPIWHSVDHDDVARYSPSLAERAALMSTLGVDAIATEVETRLAETFRGTFERQLSTSDAAAALGVSVQTIRQFIADGELLATTTSTQPGQSISAAEVYRLRQDRTNTIDSGVRRAADLTPERGAPPNDRDDSSAVEAMLLDRNANALNEIVKSFHSNIDPRTGAISRWVAGSTSSHRIIFLSYLSSARLNIGGRAAVHEIYALTRFSSRYVNPLSEFSMTRRATRKIVTIQCPSGREGLENIEEVELGFLVENVEVANAIERLFRSVGHGAFSARRARGLGSLLDRAFRCSSAFVEVSSHRRTGAAEIETTIYCRDIRDLRLHSLLRVEGANEGGKG